MHQSACHWIWFQTINLLVYKCSQSPVYTDISQTSRFFWFVYVFTSTLSCEFSGSSDVSKVGHAVQNWALLQKHFQGEPAPDPLPLIRSASGSCIRARSAQNWQTNTPYGCFLSGNRTLLPEGRKAGAPSRLLLLKTHS